MTHPLCRELSMDSKQRMLAALTGGLDADFPVVMPYVGIFLRDHWEEVTSQPWWTFRSPDLHAWLNVEDDLQTKLDMDWVDCQTCPSTSWRTGHRVEASGDSVFLMDSVGRVREELQRQPVGGTNILIGRASLIQSMEDVDRWIGSEDGQWAVHDARSLVRSGKLDYVKMVAEKYGSRRFLHAMVGTPYSRALVDFFGFEGMMVNLLKRPRLVEEVLRRLLDDAKEQVRAYANAGVHGVFVEECLSSADEIPLDKFSEFVLPYNRELVSEVRRLGMKSVYYPCGDMADRLEQVIVEIRPDGLSLEESKKGFKVDIAKLDDTVAGRLCIFGNLDSIRVLQDGTRDELRKEIQRQLDIGRKHRKFVMSLGSPVTPKTSVSRVREYIDLVRELE